MTEATMTPAVGQYVICKSSYSRWEIFSVEVVTARQFKGRELGYRYLRTVPLEKVKFCGEEEAARKIHEKLITSNARCEDEIRSARDRKEKRDIELLSGAKEGAI